MTQEWKPGNRVLTEKQWIWFIAVIAFLTHWPLLGVSTAEGTDGILCLTYFSKDFVLTPRFVILPGYPALLQLGQWLGWGGVIWGRGIACLSGLLFLIPLWRYARRWMSVEMTAMTCLMALFSPLLWQWSLKVMPDTTFLLLFWWSLERLTAAYLEKHSKLWLEACVAGVLAACVRPEGFLLLPWILVLETQMPGKNAWWRKAVLLVLWCVPLYLIREKIALLFSAYREGAGLGPGSTDDTFPIFNFIYHFYTYLSQPFYVFTPLIFLFALFGLSKMLSRKDELGQSFWKIPFQVYTVLFLTRMVPVTYQDRHMMPFLPVLIVAAGYQLETFFEGLSHPKTSVGYHLVKNGLLAIILLYSAIFSAAAIGNLSDSFGDIKRSAEFLKTLPANAVIYSDELPKTQYWAGRPVRLLDYSQHPFSPEKGDYVILHSFYTQRLATVNENMVSRFGAQAIHSDTSLVIPILTDLMEDPRLQNRTQATAYRFEPQFFTSLVYRIDGRSKP